MADRPAINKIVQHKQGTTNFTCEVCGRKLSFCPNTQSYIPLVDHEYISRDVVRGKCPCGTVHWKGRTRPEPVVEGGSCRIFTTRAGMVCPLCNVNVLPGVMHVCSR